MSTGVRTRASLLLAVLLLSACGASPKKDTAPTRLFLTDGSIWIVPTDWNDTGNTIEVIGGGGGVSSLHAAGAGGGGGYSRIANLRLSPGREIHYVIGGDTYFNGPSLADSSVGAQGGQTGLYETGGAGGAASRGVGTTRYSGGRAGVPAGAGGGGAAGPHGDGQDGKSDGTGGAGDAGFGGAGGTRGDPPTSGGNGTEWDASHGAGGGGGRTDSSHGGQSGSGGLYGGGVGTAYDAPAGTPGRGLIVITYVPRDPTLVAKAIYRGNFAGRRYVSRPFARLVQGTVSLSKSAAGSIAARAAAVASRVRHAGMAAVTLVRDVMLTTAGSVRDWAVSRAQAAAHAASAGPGFAFQLAAVLLAIGLGCWQWFSRPTSSAPSRRATLIALASLGLVLAIASYLRLTRLAEADFISPDEYVYFSAAAKMSELLGGIFRHLTHPQELLKLILSFIALIAAWARPGYNLFATMVTVIFGQSKATALYIAALSGVLTCAALYKLVDLMFKNKGMALLAALILALSTGHVLFSRMALQVPGGVLLLVLAFLLYARSREQTDHARRNLAAATGALALAFSFHPSVLLLTPVFAMLEVHRAWSGGRAGWARLLKDGSVCVLTFAAICAVWEVPRLVVHLAFIVTGRISPFGNYLTAVTDVASYLGQVLEQAHDQVSVSRGQGFLYFPRFLIDSQGVECMVIMALAFAHVAWRWVRHPADYRYLLVTAWIGTVYVLYSTPIGQGEIRVYMSIVPALAAGVAILAWDVAGSVTRPRLGRAAGVGMLVICAGAGLTHSQDIIATQLTYRPMRAFILAHPEIDKVAFNVNTLQRGPVDKVADWMDGWVVADYGFENEGRHMIQKEGARVAFLYRDTRELRDHPIVKENGPWVHWPADMRTLYQQGKVRYLVTSPFDYQWQLGAHTGPGYYRSLLDVKPIFSYASPFTSKVRLYDMTHAVPDVARDLGYAYYQRIGLYDLRDVFGPAGSN